MLDVACSLHCSDRLGYIIAASEQRWGDPSFPPWIYLGGASNLRVFTLSTSSDDSIVGVDFPLFVVPVSCRLQD